MATPPSIRQISREALGDAPEWVDRLLQPLNTFLQQATDALSQQLTPSQNFAQCWLSLTVTQGQVPPAQQLPALRGKPPKGVSVEGVALISGSISCAPFVDWTVTAVDGRPALQVRNVYGLSSGAQATLTLLVKAE